MRRSRAVVRRGVLNAEGHHDEEQNLKQGSAAVVVLCSTPKGITTRSSRPPRRTRRLHQQVLNAEGHHDEEQKEVADCKRRRPAVLNAEGHHDEEQLQCSQLAARHVDVLNAEGHHDEEQQVIESTVATSGGCSTPKGITTRSRSQ